MKKMILLFAMLISAVTVFAQGAVTSEPSTAGLSGCGFYDVVKAIAALFKDNTEEME